MNRISKRIIGEFRGDFLPAYLKKDRVLEAADFDTLSTADLLDVIGEIHERFVSSTSVTASVINIAADYYLRRAKETLIAAGRNQPSILRMRIKPNSSGSFSMRGRVRRICAMKLLFAVSVTARP